MHIQKKRRVLLRRESSVHSSPYAEYDTIIKKIVLDIDDLKDLLHPLTSTMQSHLDEIKEKLYYLTSEVKYGLLK